MKRILSALAIVALTATASLADSHGDSVTELQAQIDKQNLQVTLPPELSDDQRRDIKTILTSMNDDSKKATLIKVIVDE